MAASGGLILADEKVKIFSSGSSSQISDGFRRPPNASCWIFDLQVPVVGLLRTLQRKT